MISNEEGRGTVYIGLDLGTSELKAVALSAPGTILAQRSVGCRMLRPGAAARLGCAPVPVVLGAADSVLGALGLGVRAPGQVAYLAGTSTVILGVTDRLVLDPAHRFLVTPLAEPIAGALRWTCWPREARSPGWPPCSGTG